MEEWDLYDKNRIKTGKTMHRGECVPDGCYRTVAHLCIINSENKMLIQQRNKTKSSYAGLWDFSVGGHIISGETSADGIKRELFEELGIDMDFSLIRPGFTVNFDTGFDDVYIIRRDVDINELVLQESEVCGAAFADMEEILGLIEQGSFVPYKESIVRLVFQMAELGGIHKILKDG